MSIDERWIKSSYSGGQGGDCVELASFLEDHVAVRDSKDQAGPRLQFTREAWGVFTAAIQGTEVPQLFRTGDPIGFSPERTGESVEGEILHSGI